tara:strand:- start:455 stop:574 length:120 start_codon:yes stop_codon:yes gene_type:complete
MLTRRYVNARRRKRKGISRSKKNAVIYTVLKKGLSKGDK